MRRIGEVLPLPGLLELEGIIRGLIRRSKELKYEENKQASIAARLESLIDCAKRVPDLSELSSQLDDIKSQLEEVLKFNPRFRITQAQRKFAAWEKLDRQIDRAVELTLLRLAAVPRNALVELNTVLPREAKLPVIPGYEIRNQREVSIRRNAGVCDCNSCFQSTFSRRSPTSGCYSGRFGKLPVTYKTIVSRSDKSAAQLVEEELKYISKRLHPNVAVLAGVLQGYDGLNGYVVVTEGIPIEQFVLQARSGAAWANCIQGLTSFENDFRGSSAENITVRTDGHVVVFPSYGFSPLLASPNLLVNYVPTLQWDDIDPELRFLHKVYMANYWRFGTRRLERFVASCSGLGPGFTKLQVTYLAASSGLLPLLKSYSHTWFGIKCMPFPALRVGDFGLVTAPDREYSLDPPAWTFLDKSRYFKDQEFTISRVTYLTYSGTAPEVDGYPWLSYNLNDQLQRNQSYLGLHITLNNLAKFQCEWRDILTEARELSKHHNVSVDTMSLCEKISYSAWMHHPLGDLKPNPGATVYFHRNPHSDDPAEFWGFFSSSIDPKCRTSQTELENSGWTYYYTIQFSTYDVSNDWGRRYEELLESGIASMPGSYLGATIEEII